MPRATFSTGSEPFPVEVVGVWPDATLENSEWVRPTSAAQIRTPVPCNSKATLSVSPFTACLEATYAEEKGIPRQPSTEEIWMIWPNPRAFMAGMAWRVMSARASRLSSKICRIVSRLSDSRLA